MNVGMQLGQSQRLEQNISPQMLQSAAILQKTAQELDMAINEELAVNPLLELDDESPEETSLDESADNANSDDEAIHEMDFESGTLEDTADHDYDILENSTNSDMERRLEDGSFDDDDIILARKETATRACKIPCATNCATGTEPRSCCANLRRQAAPKRISARSSSTSSTASTRTATCRPPPMT